MARDEEHGSADGRPQADAPSRDRPWWADDRHLMAAGSAESGDVAMGVAELCPIMRGKKKMPTDQGAGDRTASHGVDTDDPR